MLWLFSFGSGKWRWITALLSIAIFIAVYVLQRNGVGTSAGPPPAPTPTPVVKIGSYDGRRPATITFSADGGDIIRSLQWRRWTSAAAVGQGTSQVQNCVPSCAAGNSTPAKTVITFYDPEHGSFTRLTETREGHTVKARFGATGWPLPAASL